jgi:predicted permease
MRSMDWLRHDLRLAVRTLARRPGYSALAILTLAIGLGLNTVAFSAVDALLFRPMRVPNARHLGWLGVGTAGSPWSDDVSLPVFQAIAEHARTLDGVAAEGQAELAMDHNGATRQAFAQLVSRDFFMLVTVQPERGRVLNANDADSPEIAALVSHRFWQEEMGGRQSVLGTTLTLNAQPATIVGVLPDDYEGPGGLFAPEVWLPLNARRALGLSTSLDTLERPWLSMIAKPRPGVPADAIAGDITPIVQSVSPPAASPRDALRARFRWFADGNPSSDVRAIRKIAAAGLVAVGGVLLIACFDVASLLLARSVERQHEFGVRAAMGAPRSRLVRQLLTEGFVLAAAAGAVALLVAYWSGSLLAVFSLPAPEPQRLRFIIDGPMLLYTGLLALATAVLPAVVPAWQLARADLTRSVRRSASNSIGSVTQSRARTTFVVLQVAGSTVFLVASLLFVGYFTRSLDADPGFDTAHTAIMEIVPSEYGYSTERARSLSDAIVVRLERLRRVSSVAVADAVPLTVGYPHMTPVSTDGRNCATESCPKAQIFAVTGRYFDTMGMPLLAGQPLEPNRGDTVIVSAAAAAQWWPNQNAVGQMLREGTDSRAWQVVGVVNDLTLLVGRRPGPKLYVPMESSNYAGSFTIVTRTSDEPQDITTAMRTIAHDLAPTVPTAVSTMQERMALPLWMPRTLAAFFGACGLLGIGPRDGRPLRRHALRGEPTIA